MEKDLIIKALECLTGEEVMFCRECGYNKVGAFSCRKELAKDALALIKQLTEEVEKDSKVVNDLIKEAETYLAQRDCLRNIVKNLTNERDGLRAHLDVSVAEQARLTEENERLREILHTDISFVCVSRGSGKTNHLKEVARLRMDEVRAYAVREMHSKIKDRCIEGGIYPAFVERVIDQIAKEMLEDKQ